MWRGALPVGKAFLARISLPLFLSSNLSAAETGSVRVFTTDQLPPLKHVDLAEHVFVLDDIEKPLASLSFDYPGSEAQARQQANALLNSPRGQALLAKIKRNATAVAVAWQSGIAKLPAVLVDEQFVVYGEYDVRTAIARVEAHRREQ